MLKYHTHEKSSLTTELEQLVAEVKALEAEAVKKVQALHLKEDVELVEADVKEYSEKLGSVLKEYDAKAEALALQFAAWVKSIVDAKPAVVKYPAPDAKEESVVETPFP
jgi:chromosome segregation ATPase